MDPTHRRRSPVSPLLSIAVLLALVALVVQVPNMTTGVMVAALGLAGLVIKHYK